VLNKAGKRKKVVALLERRGKVKSSIGVKTNRWYVKTKVRFGDVERLIKINLLGRGEMNFRMLIGRTAIAHDFCVDVTHGYLLKKSAI
jgi:hypothetical protein